MAYFGKLRLILILASVFLSIAHLSWAAEDSFGPAEKMEGKYVSLYYPPGTDIAGLEGRLNIRPSDMIIAGAPSTIKRAQGEELSGMLDALYLQVSDIADMHLRSLKIAVRVCRDDTELDSIYNNLFHADLGGKRSFYVLGLNTIYVSVEGFTKEVLGHEMAHAVICNYFAVPPPVKIQEILAMYVEYNLRRPQQ